MFSRQLALATSQASGLLSTAMTFAAPKRAAAILSSPVAGAEIEHRVNMHFRRFQVGNQGFKTGAGGRVKAAAENDAGVKTDIGPACFPHRRHRNTGHGESRNHLAGLPVTVVELSLVDEAAPVALAQLRHQTFLGVVKKENSGLIFDPDADQVRIIDRRDCRRVEVVDMEPVV